MNNDIIMSIHPKWIQKIFTGEKKFTIRKRAPLQCSPFKVYVYCTKKPDHWIPGVRGFGDSYEVNGNIVGEFTCVRIWDMRPPFKGSEAGTGLSAKQLYEYMGDKDHLDFIEIQDPGVYNTPKKLEDFGLSRPPQSWCYVKEQI